jgi:hypothetical protein
VISQAISAAIDTMIISLFAVKRVIARD